MFKSKLPKPITLQEKEGDCDLIKMKAAQLPVLVNNATTGHKLQGSGIDSLFVHNWSYVTNWPYVMLSRVKTRAGLFCKKKLSRDLSKYALCLYLSSVGGEEVYVSMLVYRTIPIKNSVFSVDLSKYVVQDVLCRMLRFFERHMQNTMTCSIMNKGANTCVMCQHHTQQCFKYMYQHHMMCGTQCSIF
jgi:hypothetical protein